jgi:predicted MFS family arabinose efflux permease
MSHGRADRAPGCRPAAGCATLEGMRRVLSAPGVLAVFGASAVARLPMGAMPLLLVLNTQHVTGSYAKGGLATAVNALALGLSNPVLARLVDRRGQRLVLVAGAPVAAAAIAGLAVLPSSAPLGAIVALAVVAGAAQPPIGACMRSLWPALLGDRDAQHAAYALEAAVLEIVYICGPLLIVAGIGSWSIPAAMLACAAFLLAGTLAFARQPASRGWLPHQMAERDMAGALRGPGVIVLIAVFALCGLGVGAVEVAVPATLDGMGHRNLSGVVLGCWGVGSMLAGFAVARTRSAPNPPRRLASLLVAWGMAHALVGAAGTPLLVAVLLLVAGAAIAPTFVVANGMLGGLSPPGTLTEAFTWTSTGMTAGVAAGSALAGVVVDAASPGAALAVLGLGAVAGALVVRASADGALAPLETAQA